MATRTPVLSYPSTYQGRSAAFQWSGMLNGDDGAPVDLSAFDELTLQVTGTFGVAGSVQMEGSNDGVNYVAVPSPLNTALALTAAGAALVQTTCWRLMRPRVTAGDGTTSLVVTAFARAIVRI